MEDGTMGSYVYKVTARQACLLKNREVANVSEFAYKPSRHDVRFNNKLHFRSGCTAADKAASDGKRSQWVIHGSYGDSGILFFPVATGSYDDDWACSKRAVTL
jgi:hypothetical protein